MSASERDYAINKLCLNTNLGRDFRGVVFGFSDVEEMRRQLSNAKSFQTSVTGLNVASAHLDATGERCGIVVWAVSPYARNLLDGVKSCVANAQTLSVIGYDDLPAAPVAPASRAEQKTLRMAPKQDLRRATGPGG
jgi:hypothetical protein